jgi:hypothetical protein
MNRTMCGGFLLATLAGLGGCSGDPANDLAGTDLAIQANPTSLFMAQGDNKPVIVTLTDATGDEQAITSFQVSAGSGAVTAVEDSTYQPANNGSRLETTRRISITGLSPAATTVTVTANGKTLDIPVRVTPIATTATVSTPTPAANEPLVITLAVPGYKFGSGAGANIAGAAGVVTAVAPDSSSIDVLLPPGATGIVTVDSVGVDYAPGVLFSLPTDQTVTVGPVTPQAGTGSTGTAPALTIAPGTSTTFFDGGTYDYTAPLVFSGVAGTFPTPSRLYKITVPGPDSLSVTTTVDWPSPEDLGLYFFASNGTTLVGKAADNGGGGVHPETVTNTFGPGTYFMAVCNFSATLPAYFSLAVSTAAP